MELTDNLKNSKFAAAISNLIQQILVIGTCLAIFFLWELYMPQFFNNIEKIGFNLSRFIRISNTDITHLKDYESNILTMQNNLNMIKAQNNEFNKTIKNAKNETLENFNLLETNLDKKIDAKLQTTKILLYNKVDKKMKTTYSRVYRKVKKSISADLKNMKLEFAMSVNKSSKELKKYINSITGNKNNNTFAAVNKTTKILLEPFKNSSNYSKINQFVTNELKKKIESNEKYQLVKNDYYLKLGGNIKLFDIFDKNTGLSSQQKIVHIKVEYWLKSYAPNGTSISDPIDILCSYDMKTVDTSNSNIEEKLKKYVAQEVASIINERISSD